MGIPVAVVVSKGAADEIDLLPESWFIKRWCAKLWGDAIEMATPKGTQLGLSTWHDMPILTKEQIVVPFDELPDAEALGRDGKPAGRRLAAAAVILRPTAKAACVPPWGG